MLLDLPKIQAIIFDMDGVLFHSSDCHEEAWRDAFRTVGITHFSYTGIAGMRSDEAAYKILSEQGRVATKAELEALVAHKRRRALELLTTRGKMAEGSKELIANLRTHYRLALASSASAPTVKLFLELSSYAAAFECILDGSMVKTAKPSPEIYLMALEKLEVMPVEAIVVEDAESGVQAAKAAGIPVIGLVGTETKATLLQAGADMTVDTLTKLGDYLKKAY